MPGDLPIDPQKVMSEPGGNLHRRLQETRECNSGPVGNLPAAQIWTGSNSALDEPPSEAPVADKHSRHARILLLAVRAWCKSSHGDLPKRNHAFLRRRSKARKCRGRVARRVFRR